MSAERTTEDKWLLMRPLKPDQITTHWLDGEDGSPGCWAAHDLCAIVEVERLRADRDAQAERAASAERRERELREALEFYADVENWQRLTVDDERGLVNKAKAVIVDRGDRARAILAATDSAEPRAGQPPQTDELVYGPGCEQCEYTPGAYYEHESACGDDEDGGPNLCSGTGAHYFDCKGQWLPCPGCSQPAPPTARYGQPPQPGDV